MVLLLFVAVALLLNMSEVRRLWVSVKLCHDGQVNRVLCNCWLPAGRRIHMTHSGLPNMSEVQMLWGNTTPVLVLTVGSTCLTA